MVAIYMETWKVTILKEAFSIISIHQILFQLKIDTATIVKCTNAYNYHSAIRMINK